MKKKLIKKKTNNMKSALMLGVNPNTDVREKDDYYATHPHAVEIMLDKFKEIGLNNKVWECACGEGHISKVLKDAGYNVYSSDLVDRGYGDVKDFLKCTEPFNGDILTNPPFILAEKFIEKSMKLIKEGNKAIFFLKVQFLESKGRKLLFEKYPPKFVIVNSERQLCSRNGDFENYRATTQCYCWYVFEKGYTGDTKLMWI